MATIENQQACGQNLNLHYRILWPDKQIKYLWAVATVVRSAQGDPLLFTGLHLDETERIEAEEHLKQLKEDAETANRAKSVFLSNMSHELRTPLTAILGYSQLLQRKKELPESLRGKVDTINRSGNHLRELINDVLEVSRIEAGRLELNPALLDLHRLLADVEAMFQLPVEEKGLQLQFEKAANLPAQLRCDEGKLRQALINLLGNAIKFTENGFVYVSVALESSADGERLLISVKDSGPGIAPEELPHLFQPFEQASAGKRKGGTGLGLVISREYARLMGGDLNVSSQPGRGSTFTFSCRVETNRTADELPVKAGRSIIALQAATTEKNILVVDDVADTRRYLMQLLSTSGVKLFAAQNGREALDLVAAEPPDLIIMDMRMAVMDGYEAIRILKQEQQSTIPIIAASASVFADERQEIMATGADAFVRKPVDAQEVFEQVARFLGLDGVYGPEEPAEQQSGYEASWADVAQLPVALQQALEAAAVNLDLKQVRRLLTEVEQHNGSLAAALTLWAEQYRFDAFLELFRGPLAGEEKNN
jgi:signal transduction histidine kinase/DNA-binding response OmpR family regulator